MQSKDFNLALKFYEAAVNWQPGKKELWEGLANAACNLGALKEVGRLKCPEKNIKKLPCISELLVQREGSANL